MWKHSWKNGTGRERKYTSDDDSEGDGGDDGTMTMKVDELKIDMTITTGDEGEGEKLLDLER